MEVRWGGDPCSGNTSNFAIDSPHNNERKFKYTSADGLVIEVTLVPNCSGDLKIYSVANSFWPANKELTYPSSSQVELMFNGVPVPEIFKLQKNVVLTTPELPVSDPVFSSPGSYTHELYVISTEEFVKDCYQQAEVCFDSLHSNSKVTTVSWDNTARRFSGPFQDKETHAVSILTFTRESQVIHVVRNSADNSIYGYGGNWKITVKESCRNDYARIKSQEAY